MTAVVVALVVATTAAVMARLDGDDKDAAGWTEDSPQPLGRSARPAILVFALRPPTLNCVNWTVNGIGLSQRQNAKPEAPSCGNGPLHDWVTSRIGMPEPSARRITVNEFRICVDSLRFDSH